MGHEFDQSSGRLIEAAIAVHCEQGLFRVFAVSRFRDPGTSDATTANRSWCRRTFEVVARDGGYGPSRPARKASAEKRMNIFRSPPPSARCRAARMAAAAAAASSPNSSTVRVA